MAPLNFLCGKRTKTKAPKSSHETAISTFADKVPMVTTLVRGPGKMTFQKIRVEDINSRGTSTTGPLVDGEA